MRVTIVEGNKIPKQCLRGIKFLWNGNLYIQLMGGKLAGNTCDSKLRLGFPVMLILEYSVGKGCVKGFLQSLIF